MTGGVRFFSAGPLSVLAIVMFIGLVLLLIPLLVLGVIGAAFTRLGLSWIEGLALVLMMLAGSFVNIPLYLIRRDMVRATPFDADRNGVISLSPSTTPVWETRISLNLGGGVIPVCIAAYLVYQAATFTGSSLQVPLFLSAGVVAVVTFVATREITGIGIRVPILIPALTALLAGIILSGGTGLTAALTALAGGVIGTLAGGNLAHLRHVRELEVAEVSLGGFGTFGAVFLCCVLPALVA
jgi:uncharacterized membrane protein